MVKEELLQGVRDAQVAKRRRATAKLKQHLTRSQSEVKQLQRKLHQMTDYPLAEQVKILQQQIEHLKSQQHPGSTNTAEAKAAKKMLENCLKDQHRQQAEAVQTYMVTIDSMQAQIDEAKQQEARVASNKQQQAAHMCMLQKQLAMAHDKIQQLQEHASALQQSHESSNAARLAGSGDMEGQGAGLAARARQAMAPGQAKAATDAVDMQNDPTLDDSQVCLVLQSDYMAQNPDSALLEWCLHLD